MEVGAIYNEFHRELLGYVRSKIRSKEDAEDVVQNVFIKIAANVDKLDGKEKLKNWIYTVTRNAVIDFYRANARKGRVAVVGEIPDDVFDEADIDPTKGLDQCMHTMIALLPVAYRDILIDAEIKGIRQKELAARYGMAYASMRSRVQRGRERLKQIFYNCCHIETDRMGNVMEMRGKDGACEGCG